MLVLLVLAFYGVENWRGKRALAKALAGAKEQGISLAWETYQPTPIPPEENIALSPLLTSASTLCKASNLRITGGGQLKTIRNQHELSLTVVPFGTHPLCVK